MEKIKIGNGYDVHALAEGLPLWLGGVRIDSPIGCIAHSDGDVAIHALCDAPPGSSAMFSSWQVGCGKQKGCLMSKLCPGTGSKTEFH
jgi:hypothetical protein